jgi:periplasmic divalent cation tolerance protein
MDALTFGRSETIVVLITVPNGEVALAIALALVNERLAACVTEFPVRSTYRWQGEVLQDSEIQLVVKTTIDRLTELEARVKVLHPYEVPEVIAVRVDRGSDAYLSWIREQVSI